MIVELKDEVLGLATLSGDLVDFLIRTDKDLEKLGEMWRDNSQFTSVRKIRLVRILLPSVNV